MAQNPRWRMKIGLFPLQKHGTTPTRSVVFQSTCRRLSPVGTLTFTKRLDKVEIR